MIIERIVQELNRIVIIGTGNLANHLSFAMHSLGVEIVQVFGRNKEKARTLAEKFHTPFCSNIGEINKTADAYFFCIADQAVSEVLALTDFTDQLLLHLSGTLNMNVFSGFSENFGVFYPLQTFTSDKVIDFSNIPICIEANSKKNTSQLIELAEKLSKDVREINSEQRSIIHVAAVFSCNFSNYFYTIAEKILADNKLDFEILKPLIQETAAKALGHSPSQVQTGPAKRKDQKIVSEHLRILDKYPEFKELYDLISKNIQDHYN